MGTYYNHKSRANDTCPRHGGAKNRVRKKGKRGQVHFPDLKT